MFQKDELVSSGNNHDEVRSAYKINAEKFQMNRLTREHRRRREDDN
jgi:hypothetical protein